MLVHVDDVFHCLLSYQSRTAMNGIDRARKTAVQKVRSGRFTPGRKISNRRLSQAKRQAEDVTVSMVSTLGIEGTAVGPPVRVSGIRLQLARRASGYRSFISRVGYR